MFISYKKLFSTTFHSSFINVLMVLQYSSLNIGTFFYRINTHKEVGKYYCNSTAFISSLLHCNIHNSLDSTSLICQFLTVLLLPSLTPHHPRQHTQIFAILITSLKQLPNSLSGGQHHDCDTVAVSYTHALPMGMPATHGV